MRPGQFLTPKLVVLRGIGVYRFIGTAVNGKIRLAITIEVERVQRN